MPNAQGFLQRRRLRLDRALHCGVRPDSTFGKGMFVPFDWRLELAETGELRADLLEVPPGVKRL